VYEKTVMEKKSQLIGETRMESSMKRPSTFPSEVMGGTTDRVMILHSVRARTVNLGNGRSAHLVFLISSSNLNCNSVRSWKEELHLHTNTFENVAV
jgi:hypothetical protein